MSKSDRRIEADHRAVERMAAMAGEVGLPDWGPLAGTDLGTAAWNRRGPDQIAHNLQRHIVLVSFRSFAEREIRLGGSRLRTASASSGACIIVPAEAGYWSRWHEDKEGATFTLRADWLNALAQSHDGRSRAIVQADALPVFDPQLERFGRTLRDRFRDRDFEIGPLELDCLLTLIGLRLINAYDGNAPRSSPQPSKLGARRLRRVQDLIEAGIGAPLRLEQLASAVGLFTSHFLRAFKGETGSTPHAYVMRARLDRARVLLVSTRAPIAEIAVRCGFASQSHLTSVMRRAWGVTPGQLRE